jgi:Zn-dependent M28 family amino/carboxypeptidase
LSYKPTNKLVFAWWGGKEADNAGIKYYLDSSSQAQMTNTAAYINLDIIGSQNFVPYASII